MQIFRHNNWKYAILKAIIKKKMNAKIVDIMHLIPKSFKAQGACSLEEPQPKLAPPTIIEAFE
jgi:S-adenosylmethionine hydrolase